VLLSHLFALVVRLAASAHLGDARGVGGAN